MPEIKISKDDSQKYCHDPEHKPASMIVRNNGTYVHTCPSCKKQTIFTINNPTL